jgi:hypothetical protein
MIRSEQEYQTTRQRLQENKLALEQGRKMLKEQGLSDDLISTALGAIEAFGQQFSDEIVAYERAKNSNFDPVPF